MDRLAIFLPDLGGGGAERAMLNLAQGLVERGIGVDIVLVSATGALLGCAPPAVRILDLGVRRVVDSLLPLMAYLRRQRPAAMLTTSDRCSVVALCAKSICRSPVHISVGVHNTVSRSSAHIPVSRARLIRFMMRRMFPRADSILGVSEGVADDVARVAGIRRDRIKVVHNAMLFDEIAALGKKAIEHPWFAEGQPPVFVAVGRLAPQKDFESLLRAFALLETGTARLVILGEGHERPRLEALVAQLGAGESVSLPGFVSNPYAYMSRSAAVVLSSRYEGLPTVLLEAMSLGTPVVATDCPSGPREILGGGRYGALVPMGDVEALAAALAGALPRRRAPVPSEVWQSYTMESVVDSYLRLIGWKRP